MDKRTLAELEAMGARNTIPPLEHSPCVKSKHSGAIFPWHQSFALLPNEFCNCDETGNENPEAWAGRYSEHQRPNYQALAEPLDLSLLPKPREAVPNLVVGLPPTMIPPEI
jgi:hypothetical protein